MYNRASVPNLRQYIEDFIKSSKSIPDADIAAHYSEFGNKTVSRFKKLRSVFNYLFTLEVMLKDGVAANKILALTATDEILKLSWDKIRSASNPILTQLLRLFKQLREGVPADTINKILYAPFLEYKNIFRTITLPDYLAESKDVLHAYYLIDIGTLSEKQLAPFESMKDFMIEYMKLFPIKMQHRAFQRALNPGYPMGEYFSQTSSLISKAELSGIQDKLKAALQNTENQLNAKWLSMFHTPRVAKEDNGIDTSHSINVDVFKEDEDEKYITSIML